MAAVSFSLKVMAAAVAVLVLVAGTVEGHIQWPSGKPVPVSTFSAQVAKYYSTPITNPLVHSSRESLQPSNATAAGAAVDVTAPSNGQQTGATSMAKIQTRNAPTAGLAGSNSVMQTLGRFVIDLQTASRRASKNSKCQVLLGDAFFKMQDGRKSLAVNDVAGMVASLDKAWKRMSQCLASSPTDVVKMIVKPDLKDLGTLIQSVKSKMNVGRKTANGGGYGGTKMTPGQSPTPQTPVPKDGGGQKEGSEGKFGGGPLVRALRNMAIDYCTWEADVAGNTVAIRLRNDPANPLCKGSRVRSTTRYTSGVFSARMKCAQGDTSGMDQDFYLSSLEGSRDQDEIDFEFLGNKKDRVQLNYYVNGVGGHELIVMLGFDCSQDYHQYTLYYSQQQIVWQIDGQTVRVVNNDGSGPYPTKPVYVYMSVWDAGYISNGQWAGTYTGHDQPYHTYYKDIWVAST